MHAYLEKYLNSVSLRKSRDKRGKVNHAILMELEQEDVPRLIEIIRILNKVVEDLGAMDQEDEDMNELVGQALDASIRVVELANSGSTALWGDNPPLDSSV